MTYRFVVYAFNKIGRSPASAPSNAVSSTSRHGSVIHTFTNANPQWNVLTDMGTMSEPSNAAQGSVNIQVIWSGCPGQVAGGPNAGFVINNGGGLDFARTNIGASGGAQEGLTGYGMGPGATIDVQSSCGTVTVEIDY